MNAFGTSTIGTLLRLGCEGIESFTLDTDSCPVETGGLPFVVTVPTHPSKEAPMQFAAFIWTKWDSEEDIDPAEFGRYSEFNAQADEAHVRRGGFALHPVAAATTIRLRKQETLVTDGPFIESKEQLSGLYIFECDTLDEAIVWASRIPGARHGAIELRPILAAH